MATTGLVLSAVVAALAIFMYTYGDDVWLLRHPAIPHATLLWDIKHHLGGNSPWFQKGTNVSRDVPDGCMVDQVHVMSRHGERYPTFRAGERMLELFQRLQHANVTFNGSLSFVNQWDFFAPFPNEQFEQLTSIGPYAGTLQSFTAGVEFRTRYERLVHTAKASGHTSLWTCDSNRDIETARYFATGLFGLDWEMRATLHIVPEAIATGGDTLTPARACPNYATDPRGHAFGVSNLMTWRKMYLPKIVMSLQEENPEIVFSEDEIYSMQEMCGFEMLAKGYTEWCNVFSKEDILSFEYARDLLHYYRAGPGNLFGPSMGWLWLNTTADLLSQGPDAGPMFLSFNHDGDIIAMLAALELFPQSPHLPTTHILHDRIWRMSDVVPMSGRITLERLSCPAAQECWDNAKYGYPNHVYCTEPADDVFVRIDVNDAVVPLPGCTSGPGESCPLDDFLARIKKRGESLPSFAELCGLADDAPKGISFLHQ